MTPSTAIQRPDLGMALEEFDLEMSRQGFIGTRIFPVVDVALATANFSRVKLENLLFTGATGRAPGAKYGRGQGQFAQDNYATKEHGWEEPVDDNEANMYSYTIDSELLASKRARDVVLRNYEKRISSKTIDTTLWTGSTLTTAVSVPWSTFASATPKADIDAAVKHVYDNFGIRPNAVQMTWKDYKNCRNCAEIKDLIKYSGEDDPKSITPQMLAAIFDVEEVIVGDAQYNSASDGQAASLTPVWPVGSVMVCKVARTNDVREPCIGRTFHWTTDGSEIGGRIEEYREESGRSSIFRVRHQVDEKVINKECGHLLTGVGS